MNDVYIVLTIAYITRVLLFDGSIGPFERGKALIYDGDDVVGHPDLFDFIRRIFGAYHVTRQGDGELWGVNEARMMLWRCPKCLGLWVSVVVNSTAYGIGFTQQLSVFRIVGTAFCAAFLVILMQHFE